MSTVEIKVPDIGDFKDVEVIEVLVSPGDTIKAEASLISIESDKAVMEIPSPQGGVVKEICVAVGDKVSEGSSILMLEVSAAAATAPAAVEKKPATKPEETKPAAAPAPKAASYQGKVDISAEVVVLGAGPGGYTAAFRAADLGKQVVLIEKHASLGGVCLNVGCIPSKALLHVAKVINEAEEVSHHGVTFAKPKIDIDAIRTWKESVIGKLTGGLA